jgi:hypothetical protein
MDRWRLVLGIRKKTAGSWREKSDGSEVIRMVMYLKTQSSHLPKETGGIWPFVKKYTEIIPSERAAQENGDRDSYKTANRTMLLSTVSYIFTGNDSKIS